MSPNTMISSCRPVPWIMAQTIPTTMRATSPRVANRNCNTIFTHIQIAHHESSSFMGFPKFKKFQKSQKNLDRAHPINPPPIQTFFLETHLGQNTHNNQQLLAIYRQNTHGILSQNISTGYFGTIFQKNASETHPLTSIVISDFWNFVSLQSPLGIPM